VLKKCKKPNDVIFINAAEHFVKGKRQNQLSTAVGEAEIDLTATHGVLVEIEKSIQMAALKHNGFLKELGLPPLPTTASKTPGK
jgi:type I restriction enzyme M protein